MKCSMSQITCAALMKVLRDIFRVGARAPVADASIDLCVVCAVVAPGHVCTSARAEMRLDSSWLARMWVSDW